MNPISQIFYSKLTQPHFILVLRWFIVIGFMFLCNHAFAGSISVGDSGDYLVGTDKNLWSTFNGTGKSFFYAVEGIVAVAAYIKTRNIMIFTGVIALAIFIDIVLHMAGQ